MSKSENIILALKKFFKERGFGKAVVGLSGGVDSALTMVLATHALGRENVTGLILPEQQVSSEESATLAKIVADQFGIQTQQFDITKSLNALITIPWGFTPEANINIRPRIRMTLLYHYALTHKALVLGTSNKSEILLGYGTKYGDFAADVEVIGSLYKTEVWEMARKLGIDEKIVSREPSAELFPGQTDADELGAPYDVLDPILQKLEEHDFRIPEGADTLTQKTLLRVLENRHKSEAVPVIGN